MSEVLDELYEQISDGATIILEHLLNHRAMSGESLLVYHVQPRTITRRVFELKALDIFDEFDVKISKTNHYLCHVTFKQEFIDKVKDKKLPRYQF